MDRGNKPDGWQLDQNGPEAYEQYLVPPMFSPWADRLIDQVSLTGEERVLDVGCGTGIVARRAADRVSGRGEIVGIDVNEEMLAVARATASGSHLQIEWRQGDATDLPFTDSAFDAVFCQQAIQFFPDPTAALREIHRVLAPDGRAAISVWRPLEFNPGYLELADALGHHVGADAAEMMRSPFPQWTVTDLRSFGQDAGFTDPVVTIEIGSMRYPSVEAFVRREAASSPLSEPLEALDRDVRDALVENVRDALFEYVDDDGIVFPMESYFLTGHLK